MAVGVPADGQNDRRSLHDGAGARSPCRRLTGRRKSWCRQRWIEEQTGNTWKPLRIKKARVAEASDWQSQRRRPLQVESVRHQPSVRHAGIDQRSPAPGSGHRHGLQARCQPPSALSAGAARQGRRGHWGGMSIARGEHTEISSFDNDNYVMAGRVSVKRPKSLYFDEVSVTAGYLGDTSVPNVIKRFDRWDEHNYTQVLAGKKFGKHVSVSADWTDLNQVATWRQAVKLSTKEWMPIDSIRFENYQRTEGTKRLRLLGVGRTRRAQARRAGRRLRQHRREQRHAERRPLLPRQAHLRRAEDHDSPGAEPQRVLHARPSATTSPSSTRRASTSSSATTC